MSHKQCTDTPRTDAVLIPGDHDELGVIECVPADFARELERALSEAEAENRGHRLAIERLTRESSVSYAVSFARLLEEALAHLEERPMSQCVMGRERLKATIREKLQEFGKGHET